MNMHSKLFKVLLSELAIMRLLSSLEESVLAPCNHSRHCVNVMLKLVKCDTPYMVSYLVSGCAEHK